jgi:hypothetical protein
MLEEVREANPRTRSDRDLQRSNIPDYSLVGFACGPSAIDAVALTVGLVTGLPYPESRPIRVLMSRQPCSDLAAALERLARMPQPRPSNTPAPSAH